MIARNSGHLGFATFRGLHSESGDLATVCDATNGTMLPPGMSRLSIVKLPPRFRQ
jgi:hypothetical protein